MAEVLLAHSYYLRYDSKQHRKMRPYPPLATLYAASLLRAEGWSVALFDAMLADGEQEFESALDVHTPRYVVLFEDNFNFLAKMCLSRMREAAQRMCASAAARGAVVIVAGPDVTDHPEHYFLHSADYALLGEGDRTLLELLDALRRDSADIRAIAGLALPGAGEGACRTAPRTPVRRLDDLPLPAWDLVDIERYRAAWHAAHGYFSINLATTRGCPYHCNWCAKPIWGQRYAVRAPEQVAEEMAQVKRTIRPDHIWFADDIFGLRPHWVEAFGRAVAARDAAIPFTIQTRVDRMSADAVAGLAQAGCREVWMGVESGSQRILDAMDKGICVEEVAPVRARLREAGIRACFFIQLGYPGETMDDIAATARMIRTNLPDDIGVSVSYPLPGTPFYAMVRAQIGDKSHWSDSGDLAMMFHGTYRTPFYRRLHRLLHRDLDAHRLIRERGTEDRAAAEALADVCREWAMLFREEGSCRTVTPTVLAPRPQPVLPPDLSASWN